MSGPDPRPAARVVDAQATRLKLLVDQSCRACRRAAASGHHLIPKGERGDDVSQNVIPLCGDGTTGCHGALHGNPYVVRFPGISHRDLMSGFDPPGGSERRDAEWVRRRIGANLRPEEVAYVAAKLGDQSGREYLARNYYLVSAAA